MVEDGMVVGLGTGSTASQAIVALGERVRAGLKLRAAVSSSVASEELARRVGIAVTPFDDLDGPVDVTIDGADEVDPCFRLIKGGGGALVREKLLAVASRKMIVVADAAKMVATLGAFPLPVAVLPFSYRRTLARLQEIAPAPLRMRDGAPFVSDDGLYIADLALGRIEDPEGLYQRLRLTPGVADAGLFLGIAACVVVGGDDGRTEIRERG
jgi:ribose 5-phosphate isomerase A